MEKRFRLRDKCRGRFGYPSNEHDIFVECGKCRMECRDRNPIEYVYDVPGYGEVSEERFRNLTSCVVLFSTEPEYTYSCECHGKFVKWFKDGRLETTREEEEAERFFRDTDVDRVMETLRKTYPVWTIAVWEYKGDRRMSEVAHYPNEHWGDNDNLQPSLMHKTVGDWLEEKKNRK